jgi:hypothetical protein
MRSTVGVVGAPPGPTPWPTLGPTLPPSVSPVIHGPVTIFLTAITGLLTLILAFQVNKGGAREGETTNATLALSLILFEIEIEERIKVQV